jgi:heme o synthase
VPYTSATNTVPGQSAWRDYYELGKPRVVALIVFTAVVGMFLAVPGLPPWQALLYGTLGIAPPPSTTSSTAGSTRRWRARKTARSRRAT